MSQKPVCPKCGSTYVVFKCKNCGYEWDCNSEYELFRLRACVSASG